MGIIDDKWKEIFQKYDIENKIKQNGSFTITANQIKEFKEPRLMTKFDTKESLPSVFGKNIAILPITRGSYILGNFTLYEDFPDEKEAIKVSHISVPDFYETIDINNITSEANAINVMSITSMLDDFLEEDNMIQTISGRMGSGTFDFLLRNQHGKYNIEVQNSQIEIDGGFENLNTVAIIEAKNVVHSNFLVRQLYYPYRLWRNKIEKDIRNVFMIYSNNIYRILEYEFTDIKNYNSLSFVQEKRYSLEDVDISLEDIISVHAKTIVLPEPSVTFVQADSFNKVISLIENLSESPLTESEIAELFGFKERQSGYYFNACKYLGLADKVKDEERITKVYITEKAVKVLKLPYKQRQLEYVKLILEHQIFNEIFNRTIQCGEIPDRKYISSCMRDLNLCSESLVDRRASSVRGWIKWIIDLVNS